MLGKTIEKGTSPSAPSTVWIETGLGTDAEGELRVLRWDGGDVDLEHGVLSVTKAWDRRGKKVKGTKTGHTRRFALEPNLLPLLSAIHDEKDGEGPVVALPSERAMARNLRRWLDVEPLSGFVDVPIITLRYRLGELTFHIDQCTAVAVWHAGVITDESMPEAPTLPVEEFTRPPWQQKNYRWTTRAHDALIASPEYARATSAGSSPRRARGAS